MTFGFHTSIKLGMSLLAEEIAFQEELCCMELVSWLVSSSVSQLLSKSFS